MQCPSCRLRYNASERSPRILGCGHSICFECIPKYQLCAVCSSDMPLEPKINYSLMELVEKQNSKIDKFIKVCFVGSSGVGKTSLIRMLTNHQFTEDVSSTVGYDFTFQDQKINSFDVRFQLWDSAGQQRYRAISPIHYKNAHIVILVYDLNSDPTKNKLLYWLAEAEKHCPKDVKIILVGNKLDLLDGKIEKSMEKEVWQKAQKEKMKFVQVSCKSGEGNEKIWKLLSEYFVNRKQVQKHRREQNETKKVKKVMIENQFREMPLKRKPPKKQSCC